MLKQSTALSCLLLLAMNTAQGFHAKHPAGTAQSASTRTLLWSSNGQYFDKMGPQNATSASTMNTFQSPPSATKKKTVFTNPNYVPPVVPVRSAIKPPPVSSRSLVEPPHDEKLVQGGQYFLQIGEHLRNVGTMDGAHDDIKKSRSFLQEAGGAIRDIGVAWQARDWEAVTYAAVSASQSMELVAQSLNHKHKVHGTNNDLQKSFAGVAVELKCLSKKQGPEALNLQGFSLRLYQASRSCANDCSLDDSNGDPAYSIRQLEQASRAAQGLAKLYGATSFYLPRRWRLWWHDTKQNRHSNQDSSSSTSWQDNGIDWQWLIDS